MFHQLDESTREVPGMDEGDPCATTAHPRLGVDETRTLLLEMGEGRFDRYDCIGDVVKTFTILGQELTHRGFRAEGLEQLDERAAHGDHRFLDSLALHPLPVHGLDPVALPISIQGSVEIVDGDRDVVEVEEFHRRERISRPVSCHPAVGSIG